jgi:hypothetical protein
MAIVVGLDVHRAQITYDALNSATGEVTTGRIAPADRATLRRFLRRWLGEQVEAAVERRLAGASWSKSSSAPAPRCSWPSRPTPPRHAHQIKPSSSRDAPQATVSSTVMTASGDGIEAISSATRRACTRKPLSSRNRRIAFPTPAASTSSGRIKSPAPARSYGRNVEELVGGLEQAELWDAQRERGKHSSGPGVGGHHVAGGEKQRLRDVTLDDDARRLGTERCRITVRADGDDRPDAEVPDPR